MQELLEEYQITQEMSETFHKWGTYFAEHYVGANRVLHYSIPEIGISLEEFRKRHQEKDLLNCQLFVDTGNGFREEEKIQAETVLQDGAFRVTFDLKNFKDWKALRFGPAGKETMYLPDRPCWNQCEVKSGQRFRKSGAWRSVFNDRSGLSGQNGRKQGSGKDQRHDCGTLHGRGTGACKLAAW